MTLHILRRNLALGHLGNGLLRCALIADRGGLGPVVAEALFVGAGALDGHRGQPGQVPLPGVVIDDLLYRVTIQFVTNLPLTSK